MIVPVGLAMAWGLAWISIGRAQGPLENGTVALVAGVASAVALIGCVVAAASGDAPAADAQRASAVVVRGRSGFALGKTSTGAEG